MTEKPRTDALGRKLPSKYKTRKRASTAAQYRWKHKRRLEPGFSKPWNERSLADKLKHLAAARKGGNVTGGRIRQQQRAFWNWYYSGSKAELHGPFRTVAETLEQIEAVHDRRPVSKGLAWDGFMHYVFTRYILAAAWKMASPAIQDDMWVWYGKFMEADDRALGELLKPLIEYEAEEEERRQRRAMARERRLSDKQGA